MRAVTAAFEALAAVLLFAIGAMLSIEVAARYLLNAPTIWAEELSRLALIWAVFLASAGLLAKGEHIRVTVLIDRAPPALRRIADVGGLLFVAAVAASVAYHGLPIAMNSFDVGRTTGSMLDIPSWWTQAAVPVGFALVAVQAVLCALARAFGAEAGPALPGSGPR